MNCPCGKGAIDAAGVRSWMAENQEARMAARAVTKHGGQITPCVVDGKPAIWVGPPRDDDEGGAVVGFLRRAIMKMRGEHD